MEQDWLSRWRVLVVEDEYFLAQDMAQALSRHGAEVIGPVGARDDAISMISAVKEIDAAVLDINLRDEFAFPIADILLARGIPFIFSTGYDGVSIPERFQSVPRWEKPFDSNAFARALRDIVNKN